MATFSNPGVFEGGILKVIVTDASKTESANFDIHKCVLFNASPYFQALPKFSEGETDVLELNKICPQAFRYLLQWIYSQPLPDMKAKDDGNFLIRAWAVADRLMMIECKNAIMKRVQKHFETHKVDQTHILQIEALGLSTSQAVARFIKDQYIHQYVYGNDNVDVLKSDACDLLDRASDFGKDIFVDLLCQTTTRLRAMPVDRIRRTNAPSSMVGHTYEERANGQRPTCEDYRPYNSRSLT